MQLKKLTPNCKIKILSELLKNYILIGLKKKWIDLKDLSNWTLNSITKPTSILNNLNLMSPMKSSKLLSNNSEKLPHVVLKPLLPTKKLKMTKLKFKLIPNLVSLISKKRKMLEKLSCKPKMNNPLKNFMLKKASILTIISERINTINIKIPEVDKRNLNSKITWWTPWLTMLELWIWDKCQWIWWWCPLSCQWWVKTNSPWEDKTLEVWIWEVWEEEEVILIEEEELILEEECNKDPLEIWWITWICNLKSPMDKELKLLLDKLLLPHKLNSSQFSLLKITCQNSWN